MTLFYAKTKGSKINFFSDSVVHPSEADLFRQAKQTGKAVWKAVGKRLVDLAVLVYKCLLTVAWLYKHLLVFQNCSRERQSQLENLHDFVSQATQELIWLNEKEEEEVAFDWSDRNSNISTKRDYHAVNDFFACILVDCYYLYSLCISLVL